MMLLATHIHTQTHTHAHTPNHTHAHMLFLGGCLSMWHSAWSTGELYGHALRDLWCTAERCCQPADHGGCSRWEVNRRKVELWRWSEQGSSYPWGCPDRSPPDCWCCSGRCVCGKPPENKYSEKNLWCNLYYFCHGSEISTLFQVILYSTMNEHLSEVYLHL